MIIIIVTLIGCLVVTLMIGMAFMSYTEEFALHAMDALHSERKNN